MSHFGSTVFRLEWCAVVQWGLLAHCGRCNTRVYLCSFRKLFPVIVQQWGKPKCSGTKGARIWQRKAVNKSLKAGNCMSSCCLSRLETAEKTDEASEREGGRRHAHSWCGQTQDWGQDRALGEWFTVFTGTVTLPGPSAACTAKLPSLPPSLFSLSPPPSPLGWRRNHSNFHGSAELAWT